MLRDDDFDPPPASRTLEYRGIAAEVQLNVTRKRFEGRAVNTSQPCVFSGKSYDDLVQNFHASVDLLFEQARMTGFSVERSYSGNLRVRLGEKLHRRADLEAARRGQSINTLICSALEKALR